MIDVSPRGLFQISGVWIRDTVVSTWIMMALIIVAVLLARRYRPLILEWLVEFLDQTIAGPIGHPTAAYLPFLGTLAVFLAVANIFGVIPGVVTPTRDISTPAAMAVVVFFSVHYFGARVQGGLGYLKRLTSPIVVFPLEAIGQLSRTLSLTLRLFGNIVSTELVVAVIYSVFAPVAPLVFVVFSMLTGVLQSYIFMSLATSYIASAVGSGQLARTHPTQ